MALQHLAPELLVRIFESLSSVPDIISLSLTCRYFYEILPKSQKLALFFSTIDETDGPVEDIIQLLTQNSSQMLHIRRSPPLSFALLSQVTAVARIAQRYVDIFPKFKWPEAESVNRRVFDRHEARRLRRAVYRLWSYAKAFHQFPYRTARTDATATIERLQLLRTWSNDELFELEDFRGLLEQLLATEICPTDGEVYSRVPEDAQKFHLSLQYPYLRPVASTPQVFNDLFHSSRDSDNDSHKPTVQELRIRHMQGWGSDLQNFYLIQSFLKFSPAQILWLFDNAVSRTDVERFIEQQTHDPCFFESGSMFFQDWVTVLHARGVDVQQAREAIWEEKAGIVVTGRSWAV
ncbi:uncharacterized protein A1O5_11029 [Cladophialophora psammophila CBS 110553]|uniref:F-box domain-containing protein n=1 Tax=Cladophialophora psammophila CBS 110553 TaxID=1182543 RepID=W9WCT9_9EURO|nr:uncharacterized protein A1O5_11029 [Cladophialophora psammophila CBS 110553]EXJ65788.1 hypothetical protein A1O5_11029 [Cladophialophora psammophila CBS 110553]